MPLWWLGPFVGLATHNGVVKREFGDVEEERW